MRRPQTRAALIVLAVLVLLPLGVRAPFYQNMLILTVLYMALAQAWNLLGGYCGQVSLGHALFFGIGAYGSTLLFVRYSVPPLFGMAAGGVLAMLVALAVGWPCFRLRGHYFVIATIVIAETGYLLFLNWDWAGAATGILIPFRGESLVNLQFQTSKLPYYYGIVVVASLLWVFSAWIEGSKWGYYWRAVRSNAEAAESLGVRIFRYKMAAAAASAFFTGVCGSFYAQYVSYIDPDSVLNFGTSALISLPAVLGGIGTLWGPALGAAILIPMSELVRAHLGGSGHGTDLIIYGALVVAVATLEPRGLIGVLARRRRARGAVAAAKEG
ncbi:MAG: branched-chain amino acid ABC transporter permease [Alphaproteobacteria bacterium]